MGMQHNQKLTDEQVEDIREEWSRKRELERVSQEALAESVELSSKIGNLELLSADAMAASMKISHRALSEQYGVSMNTINAILAGNSR